MARMLLLPVIMWSGCAAAAAAAAASGTHRDIDPARLSAHIRMLASDAFEGRAPATPGETRTIAYLIEQFRHAGAEPGGQDGSWTQPVTMTRHSIVGPIHFGVSGPGRDCTFDFGDDAVVWTRNSAPDVVLNKVPIVFAGYGIDAPGRNWNDYEGVDVAGKVVLVLANEPDHEAETGPFKGRAMTYKGRLTYKAEEAARKGARAVIAVNHPKASGYTFELLKAAHSGPGQDIERTKAHALAFSSWIRLETAERLARCAGEDLETMRRAAQKAGFRAKELDKVRVSASFGVRTEHVVTRNVLARVPGTSRADEMFLFTAHWDHMGRGPADSAGDTIYNGAMDNAGGVAGLIELARVLNAGPRASRSFVFLATTLEESGLLGAEYYAANPIYPLSRTVGGINMDAVNLFGPTKTMEVTGLGQTTLEDDLRRQLAGQGRSMRDDPNSVVGFYYRSDHFPFVKRGVPFLFAGSGWELSEAKAPNTRDPKVGTRFHQPSDEWHADMDFAAAARDLELYKAVGLEVANSPSRPGWKPDAEFGNIER